MKIPFKISSIFGGLSICDYFNVAGQFQASIGIDPDMPATDDGDKPSGYIRPTKMVKFNGSNVDSVPLFIVTNPKTEHIYVILLNGKVIRYDKDLTNETLIGTMSTNVKGADYYDNYIYISTTIKIGRLGPMDGTVTLDTDYWNADLSKTALTNNTYPSINGVEIPNHQLHRHKDNRLYICDVLAGNKGCLHFIETTKTTVEGDTDDGSTHTALDDFGYGVWPVCIGEYQTDLVVGLIEGVSTNMKQKPARIAFVDVASGTTQSIDITSITSRELPDPLVTAIKNVNGTCYVFSGFATGGCRISKIVSGYSLEEVAWLPEQYPPITESAVDHILNRFVFGSNTVEPEVAGAVFSIGAKSRGIPMGVHVPLRATAVGANPWVTAVKYVQVNGKIIQPIIGWEDDTTVGLDKITTGAGDGVIRLEVIVPETYGRNFILKELKIPFVQAMAADMGFTVYVYGDNAINNRTFKVGYSGTDVIAVKGKKQIILNPNIEFENNVFIQIEFTGSVLLTIALPILGLLETTEK